MNNSTDYAARRTQASIRRRLAVLQAAGNCFARHGYKRTNVAQITAEANVSKGLVFHFFGSKENLFSSLIEDCLNQWSTLSEYRASGADENSIEELRRLFLASFEFMERNPVMLLFSSGEEGLLDTYRADFARRNRRWRTRLSRTINRGIAAGEIRDLDPPRVAAIFHELQGAMLTRTDTRGSTPRYDRRKVNLAIDILLRGIEK